MNGNFITFHRQVGQSVLNIEVAQRGDRVRFKGSLAVGDFQVGGGTQFLSLVDPRIRLKEPGRGIVRTCRNE